MMNYPLYGCVHIELEIFVILFVGIHDNHTSECSDNWVCTQIHRHRGLLEIHTIYHPDIWRFIRANFAHSLVNGTMSPHLSKG
jgi:hypothetical protein